MFPETWQLVLAFAAAFVVGLSKTGVPGLGILVAAVFANLLPARLSSGFVLPMLILGDLVAVYHYRGHADWRMVLRLLPWTVPGILLGTWSFGRIDDQQARFLIGAIVAVMVVWHLLRLAVAAVSARSAGASLAPAKSGPDAPAPGAATVSAARPSASPRPAPAAVDPRRGGLRAGAKVVLLGLSTGFTTLVANAAGPLMSLYLLAMRLPKLEFVGTAAVFFCVLNLFKVPFMVALGSINAQSLLWNLAFAPAVLAGTWLGRLLLKHIPQTVFEYSALALSAAAAARMLLP